MILSLKAESGESCTMEATPAQEPTKTLGVLVSLAFLLLVGTSVVADDPPQYDMGYKCVLMGHSLFAPVAWQLPGHADYCGYLQHEQVVHFAGGIYGAPGWLWDHIGEDESVKAELKEGDNDILGMTAHYIWSEVEDYQRWIDFALAYGNTDITVFIMTPWPLHNEGTYEEVRADMDYAHETVHSRIDALRALYPDLTFFCIPQGEAMLELWRLFEEGSLPEIDGPYQGADDPPGDYLYADTVHGGTMAMQLSQLIWLASIYKFDVRKYTDPSDFDFDLAQLAWDICTSCSYSLFYGDEHFNHGPLVWFNNLSEVRDGRVFPSSVSSIQIRADTWDPDGTVGQLDCYVDGELLGSQSDPGAVIQFTWGSPTQGIHTVTLTATEAEEGWGRSVSARILIREVNPANQPPTVSFTAPEDESSFDFGTSIVAAVDAQDPDGPVFKVEFWLSGMKQTDLMDAPYSFDFGVLDVGSYILTATATDTCGAESADEIIVFVYDEDGSPGTVSLTVIDDSYTADTTTENFGDEVGIAVQAGLRIGWLKFEVRGVPEDKVVTSAVLRMRSPPGGYETEETTVRAVADTSWTEMTITGANKPAVGAALDTVGNIQPDTLYEFDVTSAVSGNGLVSFALTDATTENGRGWYAKEFASSYAARLVVTYDDGNLPPDLTIVSPESGAVYDEDDPLTGAAEADDPDGSVVRVEFYINGRFLAEVTDAPYEVDLSDVSPGITNMTVKAVDNGGAMTTRLVIFIIGYDLPTLSPVAAATLCLVLLALATLVLAGTRLNARGALK